MDRNYCEKHRPAPLPVGVCLAHEGDHLPQLDVLAGGVADYLVVGGAEVLEAIGQDHVDGKD